MNKVTRDWLTAKHARLTRQIFFFNNTFTRVRLIHLSTQIETLPNTPIMHMISYALSSFKIIGRNWNTSEGTDENVLHDLDSAVGD